jgi:hypothetical protein
MKKLRIISLIMILSIVFTLGGCIEDKKVEVVSIDDQANKHAQLSNKSSKETDYSKWNGTWNMGEDGTTGSSASLIITDVNQGRFNFSISANYVSIIINENGEEFRNPHIGEIEGFAYYVSPSEAYYTIEEKPEYKMIFRMVNEGQIIVEEIDVKTGEDFGYSPMAGANVRYFGEYTK